MESLLDRDCRGPKPARLFLYLQMVGGELPCLGSVSLSFHQDCSVVLVELGSPLFAAEEPNFPIVPLAEQVR